MITLQIDPAYEDLIEGSLLIAAVEKTLSHQNIQEKLVTIVVTDDAALQKLNQTYRHINAPTDVLSFPAGEPHPESGKINLGDVLISYPTAASQAKIAGHSTIEEAQLLAVHGVLHLLGYDHYNDDDKTAMWAAQDQILSQLGVSARPND
jgi:probable rRNA maturation factor